MNSSARILYSLIWVVLLGCGVIAISCGPKGNDGQGRSGTPIDPKSLADGTGRDGGGGFGASGVDDGGVGTSDANQFIIEFPDALGVKDAPGTTSGEKEDTRVNCGATAYVVERVPPDLMIVLDRSGSMMRTTANLDPTYPPEMALGQPTRWSYTKKAIDAVLAATENDISWGMKTYPTCTASLTAVSPAEAGTKFPPAYPCTPDSCSLIGGLTTPDLANRNSLTALLATAEEQLKIDRGATPTAPAIDEAVAVLMARKNGRPKYILLATDGVPNCGIDPVTKTRRFTLDDDAGAIKAVADAKAAGIDVFVVGIAVNGPAVKAHQTLNAMATAGGRGRAGDIKYYPATDEAEIKKAVGDIAAAAVSCTLPLLQEPQADASARVDIDKVLVQESSTEGWSFGPGRTSLILNGSYCDKRKRGELKKIIISFDCPGKIPPPPPVAL